MSNIHTPSKHVLAKPSIAIAARTTALNGIGVDCRGYTRALVIFNVAAHDRTTGDETLDVKIQESQDDGSVDTYADVTSAAFAQIAGQTITATKGLTFLMDIDLTQRERWLRAVGTPAGTTPVDTYTVTILLLNPVEKPPAQDQTVISV